MKDKLTPTDKEVERLCEAIETMSILSQAGFSQIEAIAKLALSGLETPEGYKHIEIIAKAFEIIQEKALDIRNCINCAAEEVGCNYIDESQRRRTAAHKGANHDQKE